jgi:hypothetical protein
MTNDKVQMKPNIQMTRILWQPKIKKTRSAICHSFDIWIFGYLLPHFIGIVKIKLVNLYTVVEKAAMLGTNNH